MCLTGPFFVLANLFTLNFASSLYSQGIQRIMGIELLLLIVPIFIIGWMHSEHQEYLRKLGKLPSAPRSRNLFDFMFYYFNTDNNYYNDICDKPSSNRKRKYE